MLDKSLVTLEVVEMDRILRDHYLLVACRTLSFGGGSGMNCALDHYQSVMETRSIDAKGIFAIHEKSYVGWALLTHETDDYEYIPIPGTACFQVYVHESYRRKGIGQKLLRQAKSLLPNEEVLVYGGTGHYFFHSLMKEGICTSIYEKVWTP